MKYKESPRQMLLRLKSGYKRFLDSKRGKDSLACQFDDICRTPFSVNVITEYFTWNVKSEVVL